MTELVVTRGLPASGKSTWAKGWVAEDPKNRVRVNRDDLRHMMFGFYWGDGVNEDAVSAAEEAMVKAALAKGQSVVVDATHLKASYVKRWARIHPVTQMLFPYPPETLVIVDRERMERGERGVGAKVIRGMAKRYRIGDDGILPRVDLSDVQEAEVKPYVPGPTPAYSFDIDGTLARMVNRGPYDTSKYADDVADRAMSETLWFLQDGAKVAGETVDGNEVAFLVLSGRSEEFKPVLVEWLAGWGLEIPEENIFMRPKGDMRNDAVIKSELVDKHISGVYDVIMHFDDRDRVVNALRRKGMKVAQVEPGAF
jgi:predicted kinase